MPQNSLSKLVLCLTPQKLRSGSTGVSALIVGNKLHIAWLGDSQVMLVQRGKAITLMEPHKPEREVTLKAFGPLMQSSSICLNFLECCDGNKSAELSVL